MDQVKAAILSTLIYSDIFNYPLTKAELWRYLATEEKMPFKKFEKALELVEKVKYKDRFFYISGKSQNIQERLKRKKISDKKMEKAKEIARKLSIFPSIELVGVSGSLAVFNADKDADIDLFIITKKNTLWTTRLLIAFFLQTKKLRRKRNKKHSPNSVCVNMLIDTNHMIFPKERRDMYTAREILQMKPLFVRDFTYHKFLEKNKWIEKFLPNGFPKTVLQQIPNVEEKQIIFFSFTEPLVRKLQKWYMKRHKTSETISKGFVAFHPYDYKKEILNEWERRKIKYGI